MPRGVLETEHGLQKIDKKRVRKLRLDPDQESLKLDVRQKNVETFTLDGGGYVH